MSNEPNEAEKKLAREIADAIWNGSTSIPYSLILNIENIIAPILAAHRAEKQDWSLVWKHKAQEYRFAYNSLCKAQRDLENLYKLRAALAAHAAAKG